MKFWGNKILITGASGFIGSNLLRRLSSINDNKIRILTRPTSNLSLISDFNFEKFEGDITKYRSLWKAFDDIDIVIHAAAQVGSWGGYNKFRRTNVDGVKNLLDIAAKNKGIKLFIYISTIAVYGYSYYRDIDEFTPFRKSSWPYADTKIEAEKILLKYCRDKSLPVVIIRPGDVIGFESTWLKSPSNLIKSGKMILINEWDNGLMNYIWIDDLIEAIILTIYNPRVIGQSYNITSGRTVTFNRYIKDLCNIYGYSNPKSMPIVIAEPLLFLNELLAKLRNKPTEKTRYLARYMATQRTFNINKVREELGWEPKFLYEDIIDSIKSSLNMNKI